MNRSAIRVCEIFESIQGEGLRVGEPSVFLRLSGCNLKCNFCDTKYSWVEGKALSFDEILERVYSFGLKNVVITGGEPLLQRENLIELVKLMKKDGFYLSLETNGTIVDELAIKICEHMDLVTVSPKLKSFSGKELKLNTICKLLISLKNEVCLKWPVISEDDVASVLNMLKKIELTSNIPVIIQPAFIEGESWDEYLKRIRLLWGKIIRFSKSFSDGSLRFIPQLHRLIFFEKNRGI